MWPINLKFSSAFIFILISVFIGGCASTDLKWNSVSGPTQNLSQVYGSYTAGCLDGAESLAASTEKYQAMRTFRKRYYGHPRLIQFLKSYSNTVYDSGLGALAIGDLSQARGGPMSNGVGPGGHASHQTGLDADIWFKRFSLNERQNMSLYDVDSMSAISMLNEDSLTINNDAWIEDNARVLKIASSHDDVERIFVNFVIKKQLCENYKGETWLNKIRPWWGHKYHYHVRLACPDGSPICKSQTAIVENDGCDETLDWWFSEEAQQKTDEKLSKKKKVIELPVQCDDLLKG